MFAEKESADIKRIWMQKGTEKARPKHTGGNVHQKDSFHCDDYPGCWSAHMGKGHRIQLSPSTFLLANIKIPYKIKTMPLLLRLFTVSNASPENMATITFEVPDRV